MKETGVEVEPPPAARFRQHLLAGEWREVRICLQYCTFFSKLVILFSLMYVFFCLHVNYTA